MPRPDGRVKALLAGPAELSAEAVIALVQAMGPALSQG